MTGDILWGYFSIFSYFCSVKRRDLNRGKHFRAELTKVLLAGLFLEEAHDATCPVSRVPSVTCHVCLGPHGVGCGVSSARLSSNVVTWTTRVEDVSHQRGYERTPLQWRSVTTVATHLY